MISIFARHSMLCKVFKLVFKKKLKNWVSSTQHYLRLLVLDHEVEHMRRCEISLNITGTVVVASQMKKIWARLLMFYRTR
jgi:hypothetical protein